MSVSFNGFNKKILTFKTETEIEDGVPVKLSEYEKVAPCSDGDAFCGFAENAEDGYVSVQLTGAVTASYSGTAPTVGYAKLVSNGGGVKTSTSGREYLVLAVDETAATVTFIM